METMRAVVTGASSGVGKALALELLSHGYEVALVGRNGKALDELVNALPADSKSRARVVIADLSDLEQSKGLIRRCQLTFSTARPISLLVNCAGYAVTGKVEDIPIEDYDRCWRVNYLAAVSLCQQVVPQMVQVGRGTIVNVGSGVGRRALPYNAPYCSAKAALHSFTESLRVELLETRVKVILFSPGPVASNFHEASVHHGKTKLHYPPFNGKQAEPIAHRLYRAIEKGQERVFVGLRASLAYHLNYWMPKLADHLISRACKLEG